MLDQACAHCPIFPTAASRRSLGRVSVPVWLIILSDQLRIAGLVGRYPTNYLIRRGPLRQRNSFALRPYTVSAAVSRGCPVLPGRFPRVTHPCATPWRTRAFDLHVLGMPPAFVLSQDQTLKFVSHTMRAPRNKSEADPRGMSFKEPIPALSNVMDTNEHASSHTGRGAR